MNTPVNFRGYKANDSFRSISFNFSLKMGVTNFRHNPPAFRRDVRGMIHETDADYGRIAAGSASFHRRGHPCGGCPGDHHFLQPCRGLPRRDGGGGGLGNPCAGGVSLAHQQDEHADAGDPDRQAPLQPAADLHQPIRQKDRDGQFHRPPPGGRPAGGSVGSVQGCDPHPGAGGAGDRSEEKDPEAGFGNRRRRSRACSGSSRFSRGTRR